MNSCMVTRDTRYLPFPKEGIEAFKRRTLDTTRHLTCSGAHSRKPLSPRDIISVLLLRLSFSISHPQHVISFYPLTSAPATNLPLSALPSSLFSLALFLSLSRTPRSACDSKPQDTCCIACLLTHSSVCATVELFYVQVGVRRRDSSAPEEPALCHGSRCATRYHRYCCCVEGGVFRVVLLLRSKRVAN